MAIHRLSAIELAQAIRTQRLSSLEAVEACLEQIARLDPQLKAFITLAPQARAAARSADQAVQRDQPLGCLHGVPIAIKDLTATAGLRTTYGSLLYRDHVPAQDDLCVARLRAAGAIILGKTSTPEFGMGTGTHNLILGTTLNPHDLTKTCGDSSGGAAVAVASGMAYLAQGTDMGGSVRTPASFCGLVGLRPSLGRIPRWPKPLPWESLVTDGVMARTVEDAALMLAAMAGVDYRDPMAIATPTWPLPTFSLDGGAQTRLGYSLDLGVTPIETEVAEVFEQAIAAIARVCPHSRPAAIDCSGAKFAFETLRGAIVLHNYQDLLQNHGDQLTETVRWEIEQGRGVTAADYLTAEAQRGQILHNFLAFFEQHDFLLTPSASVLPFPITQSAVLKINDTALGNIVDYLAITYTLSLTGLPVVSMPCGWTRSGLPVGIQIVGPPQAETQLLQFAFFLQERLGFRHRWPALSQ
ncbi:amidase [Nodosilinea sp. E11]|uniref:amidase n=1 Tax=Nodosilinea sp. E11 TaxID=3037479 RepID=UPI002934EDF2|nr:amidase [Nodosilinea sp. E11]WOD39677.1 amidase [Nodosilinea sp. E11]